MSEEAEGGVHQRHNSLTSSHATQEISNNNAAPGARDPSAVLMAVRGLGKHKGEESWYVLSLQAFQAGCYKSIACQLYLTVGGGILGAVLFPVGLIGIILTGAELFTSDALFLVTAFFSGDIPYTRLVRNFTLSWIFNFIGCLFWGGVLAQLSGQLEDAGAIDFAVYTAEKKADQPWYQIFLKGIGANFLIALAVWQATTSKDVAGKILGIWFPVMAFVELGFEHSIANMFFLPVGMWNGADVNVVTMLFLQLLPATLGNMCGGGIGMGMVYWVLYDSVASRKQFVEKIGETLQFGTR
mmetsp:Transcript_25566/g.55900  ORF Transcript_25566/g.55900 Transcript_25566/m.55900 type:complete len:298 (+) Transcript_25566:147-1040(+)